MTTMTIDRIAGTCVTTAPCMPGETPVACAGSNKTACTTMDPMGCSLPCAQSFGGDGGPALDARFALPFGQSADPSGRLAIADDGTIYVADTRNHRIRMITIDGTITTVAGTGMRTGDLSDGIPAETAALDHPVDVEIAADGSLYVADTMHSCIRHVTTDGLIHDVAGICGERGFDGDGLPATESRLDRPYGISLTDDGTLIIADTHNDRIRVVAP
jgi:hypothetical protein